MSKHLVIGIAAFALLLPGCSLLKGKVKINNRDASEYGKDIKKGKEKAKQCEKLRDPVIAVEEEIAIGQVIALNFVAGHGGLAVEDKRLHRYINVVGKNLAAQSSRPHLEWTFGVLKSDEFNAFSAPGGYVFVTTGLLKGVKNEAELAGVLGHEIAHVSERHALKVYANVKANQCKTAIHAATAGKVAKQFVRLEASLQTPGGYLDLNDAANFDVLSKLADSVVDKITSKGYAHADEYEADTVSAGLIVSAGYSPKPFYAFINKIPAEGGAFKNHPSNEQRREKLAAWVRQRKAEAATDPFAVNPMSKDLKKVPLKRPLAKK